jgi:hypothetical protein
MLLSGSSRKEFDNLKVYMRGYLEKSDMSMLGKKLGSDWTNLQKKSCRIISY